METQQNAKTWRATAEAVFLIRRRLTGWVAAIVFALFAFLIVGFRSAAGIESPDLGVLVWAERPPTEERLKPIVENLVNAKALAGELFERTSAWSFESTPAADAIWKGVSGVADALVTDTAKSHLVELWASELGSADTLKTIRSSVRSHFRPANVSAPGPPQPVPREPSSTTQPELSRLTEEYRKALSLAAAAWVSSTLPALAVDGFLRDQDVTVKIVPSDEESTKKNPKNAEPIPLKDTTKTETKTPEKIEITAVTPAYVGQVHSVVFRHLSRPDVQRAIQEHIAADLQLPTSQGAFLKSIELDFSARWMWIISGAVFLTAAVSAVLGAAGRMYWLAEPVELLRPYLVFGVVVVAGIVYGLVAPARIPAFLASPLDEFSRFYQLNATDAARLISVATGATLGALFTTSWSSFLLETQSDEHLDTQLSTLRWSFHTATFVLVAGVMHLFAFLQWPSSFMGEAAAAVAQAGAKTSALALGAVFSTLLLLMYVPGAKVLVEEARARQPETDQLRKQKIEDMLTRHGFTASPTEQIANFVKVFAPLLIAGLGTELVNLFG